MPNSVLTKTIQGTPVPSLGYGTWQVTGEACIEGVRHALELGYRHVDTAAIYGNEAEVGEGLRASGVDRDEIFLTTKVWHDDLAPDAVRRSMDASLQRLGTDYVNLVLVHWPNEDVPLGRTLRAFRDVQEAGQARHIGVSNFTPSLLREALEHAPLFCIQVEYHPFLGQQALLELAREHDLLFTAYSPIAKGKVLDEPVLQEIAEAHGRTPVQVTLRWLVQQAQVTAIPRSADADHRAANLDVFDFSLSDEEMQRIFDLDRGRRLVDPAIAPAWEQ